MFLRTVGYFFMVRNLVIIEFDHGFKIWNLNMILGQNNQLNNLELIFRVEDRGRVMVLIFEKTRYTIII